MNIDPFNAFVIWLMWAAVSIVFWGFVPMAVLHQNVPAAVAQATCILAGVFLVWWQLTLRGVKLDSRIGVTFLTYVSGTAFTNLMWWLLQCAK